MLWFQSQKKKKKIAFVLAELTALAIIILQSPIIKTLIGFHTSGVGDEADDLEMLLVKL